MLDSAFCFALSDRMLTNFTVFIPLYRREWHTRAVLEGLTRRFQPGSIHIATLPEQIVALEGEVRLGLCTYPFLR